MNSKSSLLTQVDYSKTIFSPRWFIENMLWITDKEGGQLVKFKLNNEQNIMMNHIEFCIANDIPIRIIVLKARQIGSTTFFAALGFWKAAMNKNMHYGIVAHRMDSAYSIFEKTKVFYNNLPKEMKPSTTQFSSDGITFDKKNGKGIGSKISFATVSEGVYRGQTIQFLHLSEKAFWEGDVQAIENSLNPTVSNSAGTIVVIESTAKGYNHFKDEWDRAVRGESDYTPFFFGWQDHAEYRMALPNNFELTEKEAKLKERLKLTDEQIYWRRHKIQNDYKGDETWFMQEYPATPEEAFVAAGAGVFDNETILKGYEGCVSPREQTLTSYPTTDKLKIWEEPEIIHEKTYAKKVEWNFEKQEYEYVDTDLVLEEVSYKTPYSIGIDTSGMGADKNQIVVWNNITNTLAARFGTKNISEEGLALIAVEIAKLYNDALIAPETNYSHEICNYILKQGYKNLYIRESLARHDKKVVGGIEYGWKTTTLTKPAMISHLRAILNENPSAIKDKEFWYEAEYYLMEDPSRNIMNAASGHFDDIIIATAIASYISKSFQAKQTRQVFKEHVASDAQKWEHGIKNKTTKLRKGIFKNNA